MGTEAEEEAGGDVQPRPKLAKYAQLVAKMQGLVAKVEERQTDHEEQSRKDSKRVVDLLTKSEVASDSLNRVDSSLSGGYGSLRAQRVNSSATFSGWSDIPVASERGSGSDSDEEHTPRSLPGSGGSSPRRQVSFAALPQTSPQPTAQPAPQTRSGPRTGAGGWSRVRGQWAVTSALNRVRRRQAEERNQSFIEQKKSTSLPGSSANLTRSSTVPTMANSRTTTAPSSPSRPTPERLPEQPTPGDGVQAYSPREGGGGLGVAGPGAGMEATSAAPTSARAPGLGGLGMKNGRLKAAVSKMIEESPKTTSGSPYPCVTESASSLKSIIDRFNHSPEPSNASSRTHSPSKDPQVRETKPDVASWLWVLIVQPNGRPSKWQKHWYALAEGKITFLVGDESPKRRLLMRCKEIVDVEEDCRALSDRNLCPTPRDQLPPGFDRRQQYMCGFTVHSHLSQGRPPTMVFYAYTRSCRDEWVSALLQWLRDHPSSENGRLNMVNPNPRFASTLPTFRSPSPPPHRARRPRSPPPSSPRGRTTPMAPLPVAPPPPPQADDLTLMPVLRPPDQKAQMPPPSPKLGLGGTGGSGWQDGLAGKRTSSLSVASGLSMMTSAQVERRIWS